MAATKRAAIPKRVRSYDRDAPTPAVRSRWVWEAGKPVARETITVTAVEWNGEEWWVQATADDRPVRHRSRAVPGKPYWNDLGRFWEAVSAL